MTPISVYCSGSIVKGSTDDKKLCWTDTEKEEVQQGADPYEIVFLNPDDPITDPGNVLGQFGRDMYQVMVADAVIVDARERRGLGVGVEMAAAAIMGTPIIVVAPRNSKYRSDELHYRGVVVKDYVHPHVASLATSVVDDFMAAGNVLAKIRGEKKMASEPYPDWLDSAITEYRRNVFRHDSPMVTAGRRLGWGEE
ncbi:hypothetical protein M2163_000392 [Streptomyces sp. SAI-135]|jgi:hypothetical protein|uniref:hypothetical protein n=1 Tax=unclassified Streptomyces TaxID=2593676 RepID=UPI0024739BCA|nr:MULTISPECIES: hypothetical protein [unclassified Streptomyces]MDH6523102.1 hypothetical protein [Streptomyces sp. SAI-090]MDH6573986.1 hypothetical protein [Streptomyces sp. SAI-117]MDH6581278.1 hypothetical protein [Streptomyces sp. SAI-133]MDH6613284.1 hypothetical protein [Streptomyces sp. SAI-135]